MCNILICIILIKRKEMLNVSRNEALKLVLNFISKLTQIKYNVKV